MNDETAQTLAIMAFFSGNRSDYSNHYSMKDVTPAVTEPMLITDSTEEIFCAMVLVKMGDTYLGVSRKDDHSNIGMPGGKSDPGETPQQCALRETMEETGYTVKLIEGVEPYVATGHNRTCHTFLAEILHIPRRELAPEETALVGMFPKQDFLDGFSGEYNISMFEHFGL